MARGIWSALLLKRHKLYELASPLSGKSAAQHVEGRSRDLGIVGGAEMAVGVGDMRAVVIDLKRWFGLRPSVKSLPFLERPAGAPLRLGLVKTATPDRWFAPLEPEMVQALALGDVGRGFGLVVRRQE